MKVWRIYISPGHAFKGRYGMEPLLEKNPMVPVPEIKCLAGRGIEDDRFLDFKGPDWKGQITFFSREVYDEMCDEFDVHDKPPSIFRRSVIVEDVDLNDLIGQEFEVQGLRFSGSEEATPCAWMDVVFAQGACKALAGRGGLRARILTDGVLKADDVAES